ncbi:MAG: aldo/keto reductase, partial [Aeromonas sp.]
NRRLRTACAVHDIAVTAYMPLAYGKVLAEPSLQEIAARHAVTPAQIALAWLLQQEMAVIPSSTNPAHQKANLQAQGLILSDEEMQVIAGLDRGVRCANPDFAPKWD